MEATGWKAVKVPSPLGQNMARSREKFSSATV